MACRWEHICCILYHAMSSVIHRNYVWCFVVIRYCMYLMWLSSLYLRDSRLGYVTYAPLGESSNTHVMYVLLGESSNTHQLLIVDLLLSVITCPLHCHPPPLVIRHLTHHLPSLHHSHQWLDQPLIGQLQHEYQLLRWHHVEESLDGQYVSKVPVAWQNSFARLSFLVPLMTRWGLVGIIIDGCGVANNPLLPVGNRHNAITCAVSPLCPYWHRTKVDGPNGFLLATERGWAGVTILRQQKKSSSRPSVASVYLDKMQDMFFGICYVEKSYVLMFLCFGECSNTNSYNTNSQNWFCT